MSGFSPVVLRDAPAFSAAVPVIVIGGGAAGLTAALAAHDAGAEVLVLERDEVPRGSTALSSGFIPAAGTKAQRRLGIPDTPDLFMRDLTAKAKGQAAPNLVSAVAHGIGPAIDWLTARHAVPFDVVDGFLYPGHSVLRMHATPGRTGAELMDYLRQAAERAGIDIVTEAHVHGLHAADGRVTGVRIDRPDGSTEDLGCQALVLACSGFGGNPDMVRRYIPEMGTALYFGHTGNTGDAVSWGTALGATLRDMGSYQGHGSVATPANILITWALMMEGGFQVNASGARFSNEHEGYSEQSVAVLSQPGGIAWNIYDQRLHDLGLAFQDYRDAVAAGAIRSAQTIEALAAKLGLPAAALAATLAETQAAAADERVRDGFGRLFAGKPALAGPFYGVKVTGALFHTQGGLLIDEHARVLRASGEALPNLFAAGGAACGVSGPAVWGYLSGNGLLAAVGFGRIAGDSAAAAVATRN